MLVADYLLGRIPRQGFSRWRNDRDCSATGRPIRPTAAIEIRFEAVGELLENSISSEPGAISDRMEHSTNYNGFNYQAALPSARFRPLGW